MRNLPSPARSLLAVSLLAGLIACSAGFARSKPVALPDAKVDIPAAAQHGEGQLRATAEGVLLGRA